MTSPVNLPASGSSQSLHAAGSQAVSGKNKRSAPTDIGGRLSPSYSAEAIQAAPSLTAVNIDQVSGRPAKMLRRGGISSMSQLNEPRLQGTRTSVNSNTDDTDDTRERFENINIRDQE